MAFADFDALLSNNVGTFTGGNEGEQWVNNTLADPLTLQGADARAYRQAQSPVNNQWCNVSVRLDATAEPLFNSIPETKGVSVRMWVRMDTVTGSNHGVGIQVKGGAGGGFEGSHAGYCFGLGKVSATGNGLATSLSLGINGTNTTAGISFTNLAAVGANTWVQIRLDVLPTKNGGSVDRDTVRAFWNTGTEAEPVWTLLQEVTVLDSVAAQWSPWGNATHTRVGYYIYDHDNFGTHTRCYTDGFDARLKAV